jgi:DNA-binding MltR family transcriptional regulator
MAKKKKVPTYSELMNKFGSLQMIDSKKLKEFEKNDERMGAINIDVVFDEILKRLLLWHFAKQDKQVKKLFEPSISGPLVSLTNKARLAYSLGIIDKTALNDFENIHKIRNEFAHSIEIDFSDSKVIKLVKNLSEVIDKHKVIAKNSELFYIKTCLKCLMSIIDTEKSKLKKIKSNTEALNAIGD